MTRRLVACRPEHIIRELRGIKIDEGALALFVNKSRHEIIRFERLSAAQVNVLKQTALICGADLAVPKNAYRGSTRRNFGAILFANRREIEKIIARLEEQSWMKPVLRELRGTMDADAVPVRLDIGSDRYTFDHTRIAAIINLSADSFYSGSRYAATDIVRKAAHEMESEGADFIDLGAESTRPGALPIGEKEEIRKLRAALPAVLKTVKIPVSVDTYKPAVAAFALDHGASMINDISGLGSSGASAMARTVARYKAGLVIMHIKGKPRTMQVKPAYGNVMAEIHDYFAVRLRRAADAGIKAEQVIIDPGLGFGKRLEDNYEIILRLRELAVFKRPIMTGHSRKSFIGAPFDLAPEQRLEGTLGSAAILIQNGASILRVHDVQETKRVAALVDRMLGRGEGNGDEGIWGFGDMRKMKAGR